MSVGGVWGQLVRGNLGGGLLGGTSCAGSEVLRGFDGEAQNREDLRMKTTVQEKGSPPLPRTPKLSYKLHELPRNPKILSESCKAFRDARRAAEDVGCLPGCLCGCRSGCPSASGCLSGCRSGFPFWLPFWLDFWLPF